MCDFAEIKNHGFVCRSSSLLTLLYPLWTMPFRFIHCLERDTRDTMVQNRRETMRTIVYPKSLKDIPAWRRRQIAQDIQWFTRYSPTERLDYVDREWAEIQDFIKDYGFHKHGPRKRNKPAGRHSRV